MFVHSHRTYQLKSISDIFYAVQVAVRVCISFIGIVSEDVSVLIDQSTFSMVNQRRINLCRIDNLPNTHINIL